MESYLVSDEPDAATNFRRDWTLEAALAQQAVDCLDLVPAWKDQKAKQGQ